MIPRFGELPAASRRYIRRPGVYALLPRNGSILLTCQCDPDPDIQLPGGGIDPGEHPLAALHREVMEETGWRIAYPHRIGAFRRFVFMPEYDLWAEKICTIYVARPVICSGPPTEQGHTTLWAEPREIHDLLRDPGSKHIAQTYLNR